MKTIVVLLVAISLTAAPGCGGTEDSPSSAANQTQGSSTCGSRGYTFHLNGVDCEIANAMIVMLDGRSRHQTITVSGERWKGTWVCDQEKPIVGPLECRNGSRSFRAEED